MNNYLCNGEEEKKDEFGTREEAERHCGTAEIRGQLPETALASEYEMKLTLGPATYLVSIVLTFGVSLAVGLMVARKNRNIDMVAALKTEE